MLNIKSGRGVTITVIFLLLASVIIFQGCTKEKVIVAEKFEFPSKVLKIMPANGDTITTSSPAFTWHDQSAAVLYQLQLSTYTDFYSKTIDTTTTDTSLVINNLSDNRYYWRVRAQNSDDLWGDWSDESIWNFLFDNIQSPVRQIGQVGTYGYAQDVIVVNERNRAYVADGQAELTFVDITDKTNPSIIQDPGNQYPGNLNQGQQHDFAKGVYVKPGDDYIYVADMDGRIKVFSIEEPIDPSTFNYVTTFGYERNVEDITGLVINDTLYIIVVCSTFNNRQVQYYQVPYDPYPIPGAGFPMNPTYMYADCNGLDLSADSNYVLIANDELGLRILDISDLANYNTPDTSVADVDFPGNALSVTVVGNYAYVAADWSGMWIVDITDPANPVILSNFDTSARTKDIAVVDSFAFMADGAGGLKVANISNPSNPYFVAAFDTHYAYGIWADEDYVYLTDRDLGLIIYERID